MLARRGSSTRNPTERRRRADLGSDLRRFSGAIVVTELVDRLAMIKLLDAAIGPIKSRDRGFSGGQLLVGIATAQLAGEDFLVGLDRQRADEAGQVLAVVPGLASTTAAGLARRFTDAQWHAVETGLADVGVAETDWTDAINMSNAQVAVAEYCPDWWPEATRLLIRRVPLDVSAGQVSADPRAA